MIFVVQFEDTPGSEHIRNELMSDHLAFLDRHSARVLGAGPLFDTDKRGRGGQWLIEAEDVETVQSMIREDPFYGSGLRASITILEWKQVFRGGEKLV